MAKAKEHITSYLDHIQFDPKLKQSFKAKYLTNFRFVLLLILGILAVGISSFRQLPRRLNPEVRLPIVSVSTVLAGAPPNDIESLVTIPLEDKISGVKDIKTLSSQSLENMSLITIEFNTGTDIDKAKTDVQTAVDSVKDLPKDAEKSHIEALDFENQAVWKFAVTSQSDYASVSRFAETLKQQLESNKSIKNVTIFGKETQEIMVVIKPEVAKQYNINPAILSQSVTSQTSSLPAGTVITEKSGFSLSIDPTIASVEQLRSLPMALTTSGGSMQTVPLSSLANVYERSKPGQTQSFVADHQTQPRQTVTFSVFKTASANIDQAENDAKKTVEAALKPYNGQFSAVTLIDVSQEINDQSGKLIGNFRDTLLLVFVTLFIFLGLRQAIIAVLTIPLTFLVTFFIMRLAGLTINFLSLFSLLLALGLLVDDTIVVITAMTAYDRVKRFTTEETGLLVWRDFIVPIWSTTITTVWAFLPLLIATGIIGEFIKTIPIVVAAAMYTSTAVAVLITLPLMMIILRPQIPHRVQVLMSVVVFIALVTGVYLMLKANPLVPLIIVLFILFLVVTFTQRQRLLYVLDQRLKSTPFTQKLSQQFRRYASEGIINIPKLSNRYKILVGDILISRTKRIKTLIIVISFMVFAFLLVPLGFVVNEFFPKANQDQLFVNVELPQGTNAQTANAEAQSLLASLRTTPGATYVSAEVGSGIDPGSFSNVATMNNILFTLNLKAPDGKRASSIALAKTLRQQYANYDKGKFSVVELSGGPPAGADVQVKFSGDDLIQLHQYADQLVAFLERQSGVTNVSKSVKPGTSKIVFVPDRARLAQNGISQDTVGLWLRTFASGFTLNSVKFNGESQDMVFRLDEHLLSPQALDSLAIPTQKGNVPLSSLGSFELKTNPTVITRENKKRTISVSAAVTQGFSVSQANQKALEFVKNMNLPEGYSTTTGGVNEENQRSVNSILIAMILAALLIITTMVIQFSSYRRAFIVMLVIPPAISGVFVVFAFTGTPLSFPALIGVLALFGIVVTHAMMLVDKIIQNERIGMRLKDAIADAAASRLEPIMLTSIVTIAGLVPITLSDPLWRGLGGAIISGLLFTGAIKLFFIPVVYHMFYSRYESNR